jgi:hypothetical protein
VRTEKEETTYACGDKALANAKLQLAVPLPTAKKKSDGDDDDDDEDDSDSNVAYKKISVQTDATGSVIVPVASLLAATWSKKLGDHLKITYGGKTTKVDLAKAGEHAALWKSLVSTRQLPPFPADRLSNTQFNIPASKQARVHLVTISTDADQKMRIALEGKVLAVDLMGPPVARAALDHLLKGRVLTFAGNKRKPAVLQLVVPAGTSVVVSVSTVSDPPKPTP